MSCTDVGYQRHGGIWILTARLKNCGVLPPRPLYAFMVWNSGTGQLQQQHAPDSKTARLGLKAAIAALHAASTFSETCPPYGYIGKLRKSWRHRVGSRDGRGTACQRGRVTRKLVHAARTAGQAVEGHCAEQSTSEKLTVTQLVKKFPSLYGNRRFITLFTTGRHCSLFWARWIQSTTSYPISLRCIVILSSHQQLDLPNGLFPSDFRLNFVRISHPSCECYMPRSSPPPWLDHHNNIRWSVQVMKL
jgi:hypothetical protein